MADLPFKLPELAHLRNVGLTPGVLCTNMPPAFKATLAGHVQLLQVVKSKSFSGRHIYSQVIFSVLEKPGKVYAVLKEGPNKHAKRNEAHAAIASIPEQPSYLPADGYYHHGRFIKDSLKFRHIHT